MEEEIWKDIEGYEGLYRISSFGNAFSIISNKILKLVINRDGYHAISLRKKTSTIHIILAKHFIPNPENKKQVDHIDRNKLNNHISNLRWATKSENQANRSNVTRNYKGIYCKNKCKRKKWVAQIRLNRKAYYLGTFKSEIEAALAYNKKAKEFFGEFALINDIKEDFNLGQLDFDFLKPTV